jgi:hypothetical protein
MGNKRGSTINNKSSHNSSDQTIAPWRILLIGSYYVTVGGTQTTMAGAKYPISQKLNHFKSLSGVEKCVLDAILDHEVDETDLETIAGMCHISAVQAAVAVQLLKYKNLIPNR